MTKPKLLNYKNYLAIINALPESQLFRHLYTTAENGEETDLMDDGDLSCALVVSSVLLWFGWIDNRHATVKSTIAAMRKSSWTETNEPKPGDVVVWPRDNDSGEHIGFYLDDQRAISNVSKNHAPGEHGLVLRGGFSPKMFLTRNYN